MPLRSLQMSLAVTLVALGGCGTGPARSGTGATSGASGAAETGTASTKGGTAAQKSILLSSTPAANSVVSAPVDELVLHFSPPARLLEVTLRSANTTIPTMITAVGEREHYSVPLSGLEPGSYTADWRASAGGTEHRGSIRFSVR